MTVERMLSEVIGLVARNEKEKIGFSEDTCSTFAKDRCFHLL